MKRLLITNGRLICPEQGIDRVANLLVENGRIAGFDVADDGNGETFDASGMIVTPGLIDMHVQLREPGCEEDETIHSGAAAALAGGYTTIACIPETEPPIDTPAAVEFVHQKAARSHRCNVLTIACVSKDGLGKELAEIGSLVEAGAVAFSDGSRPLASAELLRRALEYCLMFNKPILSHPEVPELSRGGVMHEGSTSLVLGLGGMPAEAEDVAISRDLRLAEATGGQLHLMNVSTAGGIDLIRRAKARNVRVTAEICPLNFILTDEAVRSFNTSCKLNPPLRSRDHVEACLGGIADGTIDVIASCHAPRALEKKMQEFDQAPFGSVGLETTLAATITYLVERNVLDWPTAIAKLTCKPAKVLGLNKGTLRIGADADITIIDPTARWTVDPKQFRSKSTNTPLTGMELTGRAVATIVSGEVRYRKSASPTV